MKKKEEKKKKPNHQMFWDICQCEANGLVRPTNGPLRIKETDLAHDDILVAKLSGPQGGTAHSVRVGNKYFFVDPKKKAREVFADTLTDALHAGVWIKNEEIKEKKKIENKKRPMPHVSIEKAKPKTK